MPSFSLPAAAVTAAGAGAATAGASTLGTIATVASLAGTGISALSSIRQGAASSSAANYNAQIAENNAKIATQNAAYTAGEGEQNVGAAGAKTRAVVGATLAGQGASGIDVNTGSDVDVRESEAMKGMMNTLDIRSQAVRQAYGLQNQALSDTAQSQLYKSRASSDKTDSIFSAGANILGGGVNAATTYQKFLTSNSTTGDLTN